MTCEEFEVRRQENNRLRRVLLLGAEPRTCLLVLYLNTIVLDHDITRLFLFPFFG